MSRPEGSAQELEQRRVLALRMLDEGVSVAQVARAFEVAPNSVRRWKRMAGEGSLAAKPRTGRRRMSVVQLAMLRCLLCQGATAYGWANNLWTAMRVRNLIADKFKIEYHVEHVRLLLKRDLKFSSQRPEYRAKERDEKAIKRWVQDELPGIKKISTGAGRTHRSS